MAVILQEINKLRRNFDKYTPLKDFEKEVNRNNLRVKTLNDEIDKLKRETNLKLDKKLDLNEAVKIVNEINRIKEILASLQK